MDFQLAIDWFNEQNAVATSIDQLEDSKKRKEERFAVSQRRLESLQASNEEARLKNALQGDRSCELQIQILTLRKELYGGTREVHALQKESRELSNKVAEGRRKLAELKLQGRRKEKEFAAKLAALYQRQMRVHSFFSTDPRWKPRQYLEGMEEIVALASQEEATVAKRAAEVMEKNRGMAAHIEALTSRGAKIEEIVILGCFSVHDILSRKKAAEERFSVAWKNIRQRLCDYIMPIKAQIAALESGLSGLQMAISALESQLREVENQLHTEIDWVAYMQEVEGVLGGDYNYSNLRGDTGPLVYPAGFVYVFEALHWVTDDGTNIRLAQWIFLALYVANLGVVLALYGKARVTPPWAAILLVVSYRVHSIFLLRCFNDCIAMFLLYLSLLFVLHHKWLWACIFLSLGVSIKMNVLLFAFGFGILMLKEIGWKRTLPLLGVCAAIQVVLAIPFLWVDAKAYIGGAFEFSRVFTYKWTVNFRFLSEEVFVSRPLALALLAGQLALLFAFAARHWTRDSGGFWRVLFGRCELKKQTAGDMLTVLFTSNFVGICCARSMHYQFYSWYFHTLPLLLWVPQFVPTVLRFVVLLLIEVAFIVFPSTESSSMGLQIAHVFLIGALMLAQPSDKSKSE